MLSVLIGAVVTAIIQSSSATSVNTISLVNAGVQSFKNSVGIIFGSNIGTTITAQLVAVKLTAFALIIIIVGFFLFDVDRPDQAYVRDITYPWTQEDWLYLAVVIDLFSRKVVGWSMRSRMKAQLVYDALRMAIWQRRPGEGLVTHSDRGSQYASKEYRRQLKAHGFVGSMSRKGDCCDYAVAESFFGSLKQERVHWRIHQTRIDAQQDVLNYISMFCNSYLLHSYLDYLSPNQYEAEMVKLRKAA